MLDRPIQFLKGVGPARAESFARLGVRTARDLLYWVPRRYDDASRVDPIRTVEVGMSDAMRFTPARTRVRQGETLRFRLKNDGAVMHEMVIGTADTLAEHAALMKRFPNMEHDEPYMAHVAPGTQGEIVWTFNRAGDFDFACLIPGHYDAGMIGKIEVAAE